MLVLSRKIGERIVISESVEVTVLKIHRNRVRLGVAAAPDVSVRRREACARADDAISVNEALHPDCQTPETQTRPLRAAIAQAAGH